MVTRSGTTNEETTIEIIEMEAVKRAIEITTATAKAMEIGMAIVIGMAMEIEMAMKIKMAMAIGKRS